MPLTRITKRIVNMAVYILTDHSFLLNHLDSQKLIPFEKTARMQGFDPASWQLFAHTPGNGFQKEASDFKIIRDTQEIETISGINPVHALTSHRLRFSIPVRVGAWSLFINRE
jgi:hypothetical protein